jgi:hypothetical protein
MGKNKEKIRKKVINFVDVEYRKTGIVPSVREIEKEFNIYFRFYFPEGMNELYKVCNFEFSPKENKQEFLARKWTEMRELKRKKIIDFVKKEYRKSGIVPSARKIEKKFNVSFWNCFPKGMDTLYKLCGFEFSPEQNKKKAVYKGQEKRRGLGNITRGRKKIIKYFKQQLKKGIRSSRETIERKFSISLETYFPEGMRELYQTAGIPLVGRLRDRKELKEKILNYIQTKVKQGFYPTYDEINEKFRTNIQMSVKELYRQAGVGYKRDPNPFLRYEKEKKLVDIALKLFPKLGYKIKKISIGPSKPKGADIIVEDKKKRLIPIEIKAFQKFGKIGQAANSPYIRNELLQLKRYIKNLHAPYGYLITSTDRKTFKIISSNIKILFGKDLKKLLLKFKMYKELRDLGWIRNSSISYGKEEIYKKIHDKILEYVKRSLKRGKYVSRQEIFRKFRVNPDSYFSGGTKEIYKELGLDPELIPNYRMSRNFDKEMFKEKIIAFVKEEIQRGHFPTYKEIQRKFRCLVKLHFPEGIREIAKLAGIKYNRKFATKTPEEKELIKQKIIRYFARRLKNGYYPGYREIRSEFHIDLRYYFKNIDEIYQKAGYNGPIKKT